MKTVRCGLAGYDAFAVTKSFDRDESGGRNTIIVNILRQSGEGNFMTGTENGNVSVQL